MNTAPVQTLRVSTPASRPLRAGSLEGFFAPKSIAVIGASEREGSVGRAALENLYECGLPLFPVNPKHATVLGLPAYPKLGDVPGTVDLVLIATPAAAVPGIMRQCVAAGVKCVVILSAGFRECGPMGIALEQEVLTEARRGGVRVLGPNCLGVMAPHRRLNATFATTLARPGNVAFISQSGALCTAVLDWSLRENVGFSAFVSVGSMLDVGWADLIDWLGDDPLTHSIILYMESIGHARSFLSAAREAAFTKPIIVVKVGRTEPAARAAASHTGALTGRDEVLDAAFRRVGVLRVDAIEDLFDMAEILAKQSRPQGPRLAVVTNAGGPGALAVDRLVTTGGQLAALSPETLAGLDQVLPPQWSHGNPVDILGDADAARYGLALERVAADASTDGLLVILTPQAMTDPLATAETLKAFAITHRDKPILASWMGGNAVAAGEELLNRAGIPTFKYPDRAAQAFNFMCRHSANLAELYETPVVPVQPKRVPASGVSVSAIISAARERGVKLLAQHESKQVLAAYGIPVVSTVAVRTEDEAVRVAAQVGYPVAVKLHSTTITHKREAGGVCLDVRNPREVRHAWRRIEQAVVAKTGEGNFQGVTVERMIPPDGYELILGSSIDFQFGPVLLFGAGGKLVEVMQDRALGLPPLTSTLARRLMERTRIYQALKNVPGAPAIDWSLVEQIMVRFSQLVAEQPWIKEIDVNPLFVSASQVVALDARVILHDSDLNEAQLPKLAIRPYPENYVGSLVLADGTSLVVRPIRPEDEPLMVKLHEQLSDQTVTHRFFAAVPLAQRILHPRLARLCFVDYDREIALVAVREDPDTGRPEIVAVARLCKRHGGGVAEFAVLVADRWQRRGLGTQLLRLLLEVGRKENVSRIVGSILPLNHEMREVCERVGFTVRALHDGELKAEITL